MVRFYFMRAVARLSLFYFFIFLFFLLAGTSVSVMGKWLEAAQALGASSIPLLASIFDAFSEHIHPAAYGSALLVLTTAARRGLSSFVTGMTVLVLVCLSLFSFTYGARTFAEAGRESTLSASSKKLSSEGLLVDIGATTFAFTGKSGSYETGTAVEIRASEKLSVIAARNAADRIRRDGRISPFAPAADRHSIVASLHRDFKENSARLTEAFDSGWAVLLAYSFALALLLSSFSPLSGATRWPVADLALCALAFRGVLVFERIASSGPVLRFFAGKGFGIAEPFVAPALLGVCGFILASGGSLLRFARRGSERNG